MISIDLGIRVIDVELETDFSLLEVGGG